MKNNFNHLFQAHLKGYNLIPLVGGNIDSDDYKRPLIPWKVYETKRSTIAELKEWSKKTNVFGIVTGPISGLFVVDVDKNDASDTMFIEKMNYKPFFVRTKRGSHYYHQWTGLDLKITTKAGIEEHVDIRGEGGYVVAWELEKLPYVKQLPNPPQWLIDLLPNKTGFHTSIKNDTSIKQEDWLEQALERMKIGNIDDTLMSILGKMRHDGWSEKEAFLTLQPLALSRGATENHVKDKINNVWHRYNAVKTTNMESFSIDEFLKEKEEVEWISEKILAKQSICFIAGMEETNKTWLCMDLALAIATGSNWLGKFSTKAKRVLYIDQEQYKGETQRRISSLMAARGLDKKDLYNLKIKPDSTIRLDLTNSYEAFKKLLEDVQPEVIIIDSFKTFHTKDINSNLDMQKILELVKELRTQYGCAFVFIYHENKGAFSRKIENKEVTTQYMAGAKVLSEVPELIFIVDKNSDESSMIYHVKNRLGTKLAPFLMKVIDVENGISVQAF